MIKNILILFVLLLISLLFVSCLYESDYISAVVQKEGSNLYVSVIYRENINNFKNITFANYTLKNTEELQKPLKMSNLQFYKDASNSSLIADNSYFVYINDKKYLDIQIKITENNIYLKDWNNKEYNLKHRDDYTNSWAFDFYNCMSVYSVAQVQKMESEK